jgi:hypothetical protein
MKKSITNALEIQDQGGIVKASDWTTGRGNFISKRAVPMFCREVRLGWVPQSIGKALSDRLDAYAAANPRVQKVIVLSDPWGLAEAVEQDRRAQERAAQRLAKKSAELDAANTALRHEIDERLDRIIAFADIGEHIDHPVKTYSSGMFARLAFAVAKLDSSPWRKTWASPPMASSRTPLRVRPET